jgi:aerotolerance regulator-like protein
MTWLNPAAFIGLLALSVPIFVHLFGRRIAKRQRFPSLRLLLDSRATPVTRSRPSDLLLLVIRCGVILTAVLALAQPRWSSPERRRDASVPTRLILVDTSASMRRLTRSGSVPRDLAMLAARRLVDSARDGMVVETANPEENVAGGASWLSRRSGLRELVIVSDFQLGALADGHLAAVPEGIGVKLHRVESGLRDLDSAGSVIAHVDGAMTLASWRIDSADSRRLVTIQTAGADTVEAAAMMAAVGDVVRGRAEAGRNVAIEFPGSPFAPASSRLLQPWQGDLFLTLRRNSRLTRAVNSSGRAPACEPPGATISATPSGVVLHSCLEGGSVAATALLGAAAAALIDRPAFDEQEPTTVSDETLRSWERPATDLAPGGKGETSPDGRWLWLLAMALLVLEQVMRRGAVIQSAPPMTTMREDRVA